MAGLHRDTLQCLYVVLSRVRTPVSTLCFSTYPALNANYCSPPLCRACAPYYQVYCPACTTSDLTYPRAAYNPFQVRRLVDLVLSHPIDAGLVVKLKPRLPLFAKCIACALLLRSLTPNRHEFRPQPHSALRSPYGRARKPPSIDPVAHFHELRFATCVPNHFFRGPRPAVDLLCLGRGAPFPLFPPVPAERRLPLNHPLLENSTLCLTRRSCPLAVLLI